MVTNMMTQKSIYIIPTEALFYTLNLRRKRDGLTEIEHSLIASKLGILFTLKNHGYINFKAEQIELDESQFHLLQEIIANNFNVEMMEEMLSLAIKRPLQHEIRTNNIEHQPKSKGLLSQIKGFLKIQANPA